MILHRRIIRELRQGWVKYGAMIFLLVLSLSLVISLAGSADTVVNTMESTFQNSQVEDGEFQVHVSLNNDQITDLKNLGAKIEEKFYFDVQSEQGASLRIFKNRDDINQIKLDEGSLPESDNEIVLEKHFANNFALSVGDNFVLAGNTYHISGIGSVPDYSNLVKNVSDVLADTNKFSVCFVSTNKFHELTKENETVEYEYAYILDNGCTQDQVKNYITKMNFDITKITNPYMMQMIDQIKSGSTGLTDPSNQFSNLTFLLKANENQRITSCEDDVAINKTAALVAGVIILLLIAYMLSVFSVHNIEKESAIIGTLYAMGYVKRELIRHFMILPVVLTAISSIMGTVLGFLMIPSKVLSSSNYYSFPKAIATYPLYLIAFGILMPIIITTLVNYFVLSGKLKNEPLKLLRKEKKHHKIANLDLKNMGFVNRYRIRQLIREIRGNVTLFFGLFIAILLMMLGFCIYGSIDNYVNGITKDVKYQYQYILSYPMKENPSNSEIAYTKGLNTKFNLTGGDMGVTLQGFENDNRYFNFDVTSEKNEVFISNSAAWKFNWKTGDMITLQDTTTSRSYTFKVKGVVDFANGLYVFMNINNMRDVFGQKDGYFNTLLSDETLDVESGRIASVITRDEMKTAANQMFTQMSDMIVTIISASVILFVIIMYLLLKMMIDKATFSISLIKVFGYSQKEVKKLYLGSNFYTVLITMIISLPVTKIIISMIYPSFISNVSVGMPTVMPIYLYLIMIGIIMGSYLLVNALLSRHLENVSLVEILKERE